MEASTREKGVAQWYSPSNIAIVKYWGKKGRQRPQNASVSFTLSRSQTHTQIEYSPRLKGEKVLRSFHFEGQGGEGFKERVQAYLESMTEIEFPWLQKYSLALTTQNTFPHSCGLASSASAFSALALCLCEIDQRLKEPQTSPDFFNRENREFWRGASRIAREGSGSACRSLFAPMSLWGKCEGVDFSQDEFAEPLKNIHPSFLRLRNVICLVDKKNKSISSRMGHKLMDDCPFSPIRYKTANERVIKLMDILRSGDLWAFIQLAEEEAMALHGMMMLSPVSYLILKPNSLHIMEKIRDFRRQTHIPVGFTVDAGPNIHLIYFDCEGDRGRIRRFLLEEITPLTEGLIEDELGTGPRPGEF